MDGGINDASNPTIYSVESNTITLKAPTKDGYTFAGWDCYNDYSSTGDCVTGFTQIVSGTTGNLNIYAQWIPNQYTIKFHKNGATSGKMSNLTDCQYDASYKLTTNAFQKKGYKFTGWNTKKNGKGKAYKNKASVKNLVSTNGKTVTLYAQWKKK